LSAIAPSIKRLVSRLRSSRSKEVGCEKVFAEKVSSVAERAQLETALDYAREGDILVVTKLDRLARSVPHPRRG
jgi:DNA invertase Pin-like site-specific DNA recombinase